MKEFVTAVEANEDETREGWVEFKVDGRECRARRPSPGQVAYLTAAMHKRAAISTQVAGVINFCMSVMDEDTASYLAERLLDQGDRFDLPQIEEIIAYLVEEWSGRPTEASSASVPTAPPTGPSSTENVTPTYSVYDSTAS